MNKIIVVLLGLSLLPRPAMAATAEVNVGELFGKIGDQPGAFVLHFHCGDGTATGELLKRANVIVQGLDSNAENVAKARRNPAFREEYGRRVTFNLFDGENLPFIDNSVNVILSSNDIKVSLHEIHRVLTPGGIAIFRSDAAPKIGKDLTRAAVVEGGRYDGYWRLEKLWPPDIDEWTHHLHGPDNSRVANDTRIAPPLSHLQWTGTPRFTRHHEHMSSFQAMVSARGRVFYIMDEGKADSILLPPDWNLVARDGFNGIVLWRKKLDHWFNHMWPFKSGPLTVTRRLVAKEDRLFVALDITGGVSVLDANNGALLHTLPGTEGTEEIVVDGDRLFLVKRKLLSKSSEYQVRQQRIRGGSPSDRSNLFAWNRETWGQRVMAFDVGTQETLWERQTPVAPFGLGARNGNVYVFDGERVLSLRADNGKENWISEKIAKQKVSYLTNYGCNLVCGEERILLGSATGNDMVALSAEDGAVVWKATQYRSGRHSPKDLFLIGDAAWTAHTIAANMALPGIPSSGSRKTGRITGYDLKDGSIVADFYTDSDVYFMNSRCHMSCATEKYFITSRTGTELVSPQGKQKWHLHHWLRGACLYGLMPANGMLYAPPSPCACYMQSKLSGFNAVTGRNIGWERVVQEHQGPAFVRGPAFPEPVAKLAKSFGGHPKVLATSATTNSEPDEWPVYRHDNRRSGATTGEVALPLTTMWRSSGYEDLTGGVVANGRCFFAEKDRHTLHCLDAETGDAKWLYVAGGRIDSPPTIQGKNLFFGCADGWLYRLLATTGELVWRRRIAPADLCLFDRNQPASVWPMSGSVLVQDRKVYCVAGRNAFLDGGMRLTVVDAASGDVLVENIIDHRDPDNGKDMHQHVALQNMPVALPDLLTSDGKHLYMRSQQFDLNGRRTHVKNSAFDENVKMGVGREHLFAVTGFLDDSSFHRSYWIYGNSYLEGCSVPDAGWFEMGRISPSGKILSFDDTTVYGYGQFPEYSKWSTPVRYSLFAVNKVPKGYQAGKSDRELHDPRMNWRKWRSARCPKVEFDFHWKTSASLRAKAIVKTRKVLFIAGPEDLLDEEIVFQGLHLEENKRLLQKQNEALTSRRGGKLLAVSVRDGSTEQVLDLESPPVWDGMAAAYGKLFFCCRDGSVIALNTGKELEGRKDDERPPRGPLFVEEFKGLGDGTGAETLRAT